MPTKISGETYYRSLEACKLAGISQATFFRWLREGIIEDTAIKDRRGWRLFTEEDIEVIKREVGRVSELAFSLPLEYQRRKHNRVKRGE